MLSDQRDVDLCATRLTQVDYISACSRQPTLSCALGGQVARPTPEQPFGLGRLFAFSSVWTVQRDESHSRATESWERPRLGTLALRTQCFSGAHSAQRSITDLKRHSFRRSLKSFKKIKGKKKKQETSSKNSKESESERIRFAWNLQE